MVQLSNSPQEAAVIEAEARKSFSFGVWLKDRLGNPVDITGTSMTFTAGKLNRDGTSTILLSKVAAIQNPLLGYSVVQAQAADLDAKTGVYQFTLTLRMNGYSVVLLKGDFKLLENTEWASVDETFTAVNPSQGLEVKLRDKLNVHVTLSNSLAPNLSTPVDGTDAGVAGFIGDVTSLTRVALDTLYVSHVELGDQLALTLDAANDYTDAGLALKADTTYVNSQLALKANTTYVNSQLALKASNTYVNSAAFLRRGTTAQRDAAFGVPTTDAQRVALANQKVTWFNTDKGWEETYYALATLPGLTAKGVAAPAGYTAPTSAWYPAAGTLAYMTRIKNNGFQSAPGGTFTKPQLLGSGSTAYAHVGGLFTAVGDSAIAPTIAGLFDVTACIYWSGGGAMVYTILSVRYLAGTEQITSVRAYGAAADMQQSAYADAVYCWAGQAIELEGAPAGNHHFYGDGVSRRTFLSIRYAGPPLVS